MGIEDASKSGFEDSFLSADGISYVFGTWNKEASDKSSNFREFGILLIVSLKKEYKADSLILW